MMTSVNPSSLLRWLPALLVLGFFVLAYAYESWQAQGVRMVVQIRPEQIVADGQSKAEIVVRVSNADGSPRVGDTLELTKQGAGVFDRFRALSDPNGEARFEFIAARSNVYRPAAPVPVTATNTSLGHVIEVTKSVQAVIKVVEPKP